MLKQPPTFLAAMIVLWTAALLSTAAGQASPAPGASAGGKPDSAKPQDKPQARPATNGPATNGYEGKIVQAIQLPGVAEQDRAHMLELLPQKTGDRLDREKVRDSIRALYATGRFADIQAEVAPWGDLVALSFTTSPNFFLGAINVEGAPARPTQNQIVNASKLQLGERYTQEKLDRALENIRQLMQEGGYYKARVTAESVSAAATQQVDVLFHITPGQPAHVGEVKVTGTSAMASGDVQKIAHLTHGDRISAARVSGSLQRLRKRFQKQNRALAQVSIAEQSYRGDSNAVDFTFQIDPGPVVVIYARGYKIGRGALKREVPVYEENAVDDDLLNEGQRNLLNYLQTRGYFDATVEIEKVSDAKTLQVIYKIDPGPRHRLSLVEITGNKDFLDTAQLRSYLEIQPATRFDSHGRFSETLLKNDVTTLESLYRSSGFRQVKIQTKVDDDYRGVANRLAVHIQIEEGVRTRIGELNVLGAEKVAASALPELSAQPGQPYSEQDLANDRERILTYYYDHGFPNAALEITTKPSDRDSTLEDVNYTIQEGERFTVNRVMVAGTEHTRGYVVQRELEVKEKEPLSQQDLLNTQTRLYDLGIFSEVDTAVQNPEGTDPQKNVLVQVQEAKRYTFTYGVGLEFETGQPAGTTSPQGTTGVSPRVEFDVTRLNFGGRDQTLTFQSHVGYLQQRGLVSYAIPKLFDNNKLKLIYTIFFDNSLDVATFTSERLEGKIDLRQQFGNAGVEPGSRAGPNSLTYRMDFRLIKADHFASGFSAGEIAILSLPARVGGPGFTFIHDKRDNPLESTKGNYFTLDAFAASSYFGSRSETSKGYIATNFGRALAQHSTYYVLGKGKPGHQFVLARSTTIGIEQPFQGTKVLAPGSCPLNSAGEPTCTDIATIPLPEQFFAGGGNSHRGFGLNQAGPRDPNSGFPVGGSAQFVNSFELRLPPLTLPVLGEGFGFAIFHDMGNVFTAQHDMIKGLGRWHQQNPAQCVTGSTTDAQCVTNFDNSGYDYTSHAVGLGVRYKTPIGPLRFDFGYNLNPTRYFQLDATNGATRQRLGPFNVFFSIGQPF